MKKNWLVCVFICFSLNFANADDFTDMLQDLAMQTACLGAYSSTEAGSSWIDDPQDYYQPYMMAERFAEISGNRTRIQTFYGICFDYANCAYDYIERDQNLYNKAGMLDNQFWIAICASDSNIIELSNPVSAEEGTRIWNGVYVKTYGNNSYVNVKSHGKNTTYHAWVWIQRYDGVWFWIDPTWTDNCGYIVYGYVGNGKEIQCRPNKKYCVNYTYELDSLPEPPKAGKIPNTSNYRDPVLVDEKGVISDNQCYYWKFTVPENSEYIEIICKSDAILHSIMSFAVVATEDDVNKFDRYCRGYDETFYYITGTYKRNVQTYSVKLQDLVPGETYYFCAFKGFALFARGQYEIETTIRTW